MSFLEKLFDRVNKKYQHPTKPDFKKEYRFLGSDLVEDMLKDMEEIELIKIENTNGRIKPKKFDILK